MKFIRLSATITATVLSLMSGFHTRAIATEPDYICFMTTSSGQVLDLSDSLCHSKKSQLKDANNPDQAFIEAYKHQAMRYPAVSDNLLASIQESPEEDIRQAKSICSDLRSGVSLDEIKQAQSEENNDDRASTVNATIINNLAAKYYCPEINN
jgi:hypothetical protein